MSEPFTTGNLTVLKPDSDFEMVPGDLIRTFDVMTVGVYCKILTLGQNWKFNVRGLASMMKIGSRRMQVILGEIEAAGYLKREPRHTKKGTFAGWNYIVFGNCLPEQERTVWSKNRQAVETDRRSEPLDGENRQAGNCAGIINILENNSHTERDIQTDTPSQVSRARESKKSFTPPTVYDVEAYCAEAQLTETVAQNFCDHYAAAGWRLKSGVKMADWKAAARNWNARQIEYRKEREARQQRDIRRNETAMETTLREMRDWDKNKDNDPFYQQYK